MFDEIVEANFPDASDPNPRRQRRKVVWFVVCAVVMGAAGLVGAFVFDWLTKGPATRHEKQVEEDVDRSGPAFAASVRPDMSESPYVMTFDRPFSAADRKRLLAYKDSEAVLPEFGREHHGRGVDFPGAEVDGFSTSWLVDLLSDRDASLVITGMRAKGLRCKPAAANTVIIYQPEGVEAYAGMLYDLSKAPAKPLITGDEEEHWNEPFFRYKKINLGNRSESAGLRIEVTSGFQDCTWKAFEATYVDSEGTHRQDITNNGKPFAVRGVARKPAQVFSVNVSAPIVEDCTRSSGGIYDCGYPGWRQHAKKSGY